jgi:putative FmdB family regulatory protein
MPIYAYKCESCGHAKDVLQKMSDDVLTQCPECGQATFKKQLTAAGFQLKGSGWYVTDFREGSKAKDDKKPDDKAATTATPAAAPGAEVSAATPASTEKPAEKASPTVPQVAPVSTNTPASS